MPTERPHVLLVANRTCPCPDVLEDVRGRSRGGPVRIVAPALNSRLRHWVSDSDDAVAAARARLEGAVTWLADRGVEAHGVVGDSHPIVAIADALADFPATELVISTHPPEHSNWLERGLVEKAQERFRLPVTHLVSRHDLAVA